MESILAMEKCQCDAHRNKSSAFVWAVSFSYSVNVIQYKTFKNFLTNYSDNNCNKELLV